LEYNKIESGKHKEIIVNFNEMILKFTTKVYMAGFKALKYA